MINTDEHQKLLAQVAQLKRDSTNFFDVEKEFFLITSDNLSEVMTRLYGYAIQATGIYEDDNLTETATANLDGRGCYVYVEARDGQITVKQDLNGCWGLYLFRHGEYFALSNSFFQLVDHVKYRYPLSVNRDYCHHLLLNEIAGFSYSETAVNEIQLLDRSAIVHIDLDAKSLELELTDYREQSVSLDTEEGLAALDRWLDFWSNFLFNLAQRTRFIKADLSGGFDSRMAIIPLLHSGLDLGNVQFNSVNDALHTHPADYKISSRIAEHYGFELNQPFPAQRYLNYSLADVFNFNLYGCQTFSSIPRFRTQKSEDKVYNLSGYGGEAIRKHWHSSPNKFLENQLWKLRGYSPNLFRKVFDSLKIILESAFNSVCNKYRIMNATSEEIPQYFYQETRCRHHFGKLTLHFYLGNDVKFSPLLDPTLRTLQLNTPHCPDYNLLMTLLFVRYTPDLLTFPFQGNRSIASETVAYAQRLNARFPYRKTPAQRNSSFHIQPRDLHVERLLATEHNNKALPTDLPEASLKAIFDADKIYKLFTSCFDEELYRYAAAFYDKNIFGRERRLYAVVGVARVIEDVNISKQPRPPREDLTRFIVEEPSAQIVRRFKNFFTARIEFQLLCTGAGVDDLQILSVSDDTARIEKGNGYAITSYSGQVTFSLKALVDGQIRLDLRGANVRNPDKLDERIPYRIDYTKLIVNGKVVFDTPAPVWYEDFCRYDITNIKAGTAIEMHVEWLPHMSDT